MWWDRDRKDKDMCCCGDAHIKLFYLETLSKRLDASDRRLSEIKAMVQKLLDAAGVDQQAEQAQIDALTAKAQQIVDIDTTG